MGGLRRYYGWNTKPREAKVRPPGANLEKLRLCGAGPNVRKPGPDLNPEEPDLNPGEERNPPDGAAERNPELALAPELNPRPPDIPR